MAGRKPRYAGYELRRMSPKELLELASRSRISLPGKGVGMERKEIIDVIAHSGRIEVIAAPEPVEHRLSDLRALGVGKLRRTMEEAGVFFSKEDVVEKGDMVDLFVRSGRVALLPENEDENEEEDDKEEEREEIAATEEETTMNEPVAPTAALESEQTDRSPPRKRRSVVDAAREEEGATWSDASSSQGGNSIEQKASSSSNLEGDEIPSVIDMFGGPNETGQPLPPPPPEVASAAAPGAARSNTSSHSVPPAPSAPPYPTMNEDQEAELDAAVASGSLPNVTRNTRIASYGEHSVSELKSIASGLGIDVSDCVEKREMIGRIADYEAYVDIDA